MFGFQYSPAIISSIRLENLEVSAQSAADSAASALTQVQALFDQVLEYRNESQFYYTQVQQIQEGDYVTTQSLTDRLGEFAFSELQNIPETFPPSAHNHHWNGITGKPIVFPPESHRHSWTDLDDKPTEFEPAEHAHSWLQIEGKPATFPPEMHYHDWSSIENKPTKFNPVAHQHSWGDVTGKPATFPPSAHSHDWDAISGKPDLYHSGNSVNPLHFGIGTSGTEIESNDNPEGGFFRSGNIAPTPSAVINFRYNNKRAAQFLASVSADASRFYGRTQIADDVWSPRVEFHTTGNLNDYDFSGGSAGSAVTEVAYRRDGSRVRCFLRISKKERPTSITVKGTFELIDKGYNVVASNLGEDEIELLSSTKKLAQLNVSSGGATLPDDDYFYLRPESEYSGIKVL